MILIWLRSGNLKRETKSLDSSTNNALRTKYVKVKIDIIQRIASAGYVVAEIKQLII